MSRVTREAGEVVLRLPAGTEAASFARFLHAAAEAIRLGHINTAGCPDVGALRLRQLADRVNGVNS